MNKKVNTVLFFLVATVINILLVMVIALALFIPYVIFVARIAPSVVNLLALVLILVGAMAGSFPLYRGLVNEFQKRVDMEKYFDPIVKSGRRPRP